MSFFTIFNINFKKISLQFFISSLLNWDVFSTHLKPYTGNFWDISYPRKLFISQYLRYDDSCFDTIIQYLRYDVFIIVFHVFFISFCILMNRMTYFNLWYLFLPLTILIISNPTYNFIVKRGTRRTINFWEKIRP